MISPRQARWFDSGDLLDWLRDGQLRTYESRASRATERGPSIAIPGVQNHGGRGSRNRCIGHSDGDRTGGATRRTTDQETPRSGADGRVDLSPQPSHQRQFHHHLGRAVYLPPSARSLLQQDQARTVLCERTGCSPGWMSFFKAMK